MQTIDLDICRYHVPQPVCVKQGDVGRKFQAKITDCGEDYPIPEGAKLSVWYSGTSGEGNYSAIGENSAFSVEGNTVTVELIAQMLTNKGGGSLCLVLHGEDGTQLGMWNIPYIVEPVPGMDSPAAEQYYTALTEAATKAAQSAANAEAAAQKLVIDATLSKAGQAADAANTGGRIRRAEKNIETLQSGYSGWLTVNSQSETPTLTADEQILSLYAEMEDGTTACVIINVVYGFDTDFLTGGMWSAQITRISEDYGSILAWKYSGGPSYISPLPDIAARNLFYGSWADWHHLVNERRIWLNSSPASAFAAAEIEFTEGGIKMLKSYNAIRIVCRHTASIDYMQSVFIIKEPEGSRVACAHFASANCLDKQPLAEMTRYFSLSDSNDKVYVYQGRTASVNSYGAVIPVAIYACNI